MQPQKKALVASIVFTLLMSAGTAVNAELKIGHIASMTGPIGAIGKDQYDGFMLRVEQGKGSLGGQKVEVISTDEQRTPEAGLQAARELVEKQKVNLVVGVTASNVLNVVFPYVVNAELPFISTNGGSSIFAGEQCSPWFVSTGFQSDSPHEAAGQEAKKRGYKKVVLITPNYQAGKDAVAGFKRFYKEGVADEMYPAMGQADYSAEITQIIADAPDAVYAFLPGAMGITFIKQYAMAGLMKKYPVMSSWTVDDLTIRAIGEAALGSIVSAHWTSAADNPQSKKFVADFESRYKRKPSVYAMQGYDAALLIDQALQSTPNAATDKKALMKALRPASFASTRGDIRFNKNGFPIQDYKIWEVVKQASGKPGFELRSVALPAHEDAYASACRIDK